MHIDQDALDFMTRFFEFKDDSSLAHEATAVSAMIRTANSISRILDSLTLGQPQMPLIQVLQMVLGNDKVGSEVRHTDCVVRRTTSRRHWQRREDVLLSQRSGTQ